MKIRLLLWIGFMCVLAGPAAAQWKPFGSVHAGYTIPIHPDYPEIQRVSGAVMVGGMHALSGNKQWHYSHRNARIGLGWTVLDAGNPQVLGQATGPLFMLDGHLLGSRDWQLRFTLGTGAAWMTRPYDRQTNPTNIVVGSRITSLFHFQLYNSWRVSARYSLQLGLSAWHYSAARVRVPNLGINVPALMIGIVPHTDWEGGAPRHNEIEPDGRIRPGIRLGMGFTSRKTPGGPLYPVPTVTGLVHSRMGRTMRWQAGFKGFYEESLFAFFQSQDFGRQTPQRDAMGLIAWVGAEWLFGRLGINARLGPYLKRPVLMNYPLYTELGIQYYLRDQQLYFRNQPFIGLYVHAHSGEADWAELALGWLF